MAIRLFLCSGVLLLIRVASVAAEVPDFERDIRPILSGACLSCHGPQKQKAGLRLDRRAEARKGGDSGPAFVPGKPGESLLLQLVSGADADRVMPPEGKRLDAGKIALLKSWIEGGAVWPADRVAVANPADWWSLKPLVRPSVPGASPNAIDAFIDAKMKEKHLKPVGLADKLTLIRRVTFDLTGLPPTPAEIDDFLKDSSGDAYSKLVDRLLASPRYGERWARHWLDVVHYGETHGYDKDKPRPNAWPYRDYVIRAFNEGKPYSRFVREQLAGDRLYPGTADGIEALGFLSAGPWDYIGHAELPETKTDGKIARHLDRDDMVANTIGTFMGLTVHCAQCHNHKFDPISQEDYYRLQAVFAGIDRTDKSYDADPSVAAQRARLRDRRAANDATITALELKAGHEVKEIDKLLAVKDSPAKGSRPGEHGYHSALAKSAAEAKWVQIEMKQPAKIAKVVLHACHDDFNGIGAGFGFPLRFKVEASNDPKFDEGVALLANFTKEDYLNPGLAAVEIPAPGASFKYIRVTALKLAPRLATDYMFALAELEARDANGTNVALQAGVGALDSIEAPSRWRKSNLTDGLYPTSGATPKTDRQELVRRRREIIDKNLTETERADYARATEERSRLGAAERALPPMKKAYIGTVHFGSGNFAGTQGTPRPIFILNRGDVSKPGKEVGPGGIAAVPGINGRFELSAKQDESERRAALAEWIVDPKNPLTWRVIANRVWQYHFGHGLVDTPNDFGRMGRLPTHPELLDWLAVEFRDGGQDFKKLHKLILTSEAYRRSAANDAANAEKDGDNQYLWRQNRRKLEAEAVRDSILAVAGKLDLTMGGPSFQDFVVEKPEHSPHYMYELHDPEDPKAWRRAVYRFIVRSKQQPFMASLDCADPSLAVEKRNETITPQQALTLLNNPLSLAMARHFGERMKNSGKTDAERIEAGFRLAFGRSAKPGEIRLLSEHAAQFGWENVARLIFNMNEFAFVD